MSAIWSLMPPRTSNSSPCWEVRERRGAMASRRGRGPAPGPGGSRRALGGGARVAIGGGIVGPLGGVAAVTGIGVGAWWLKGKAEKAAGGLQKITAKAEEIEAWEKRGNAEHLAG